ncbi:hypothetical protein B0H34DRAFT_106275 [Crassisporium funariophilum]|nr:hypothetical protein B0H34DRAFT_106275 [Crassisporium funariophilum]
MSRIPGVTRWPSKSDIQKESVCSQLDAMLSDLHSLCWTPGTPRGHSQLLTPARMLDYRPVPAAQYIANPSSTISSFATLASTFRHLT